MRETAKLSREMRAATGFRLIHGPVVYSHDVLGEIKGEEINTPISQHKQSSIRNTLYGDLDKKQLYIFLTFGFNATVKICF